MAALVGSSFILRGNNDIIGNIQCSMGIATIEERKQWDALGDGADVIRNAEIHMAKRDEENRNLRMKLKEKESFIDALEKTEQYYCNTCGLYGDNRVQHEKYCKAECITLKGANNE